MGSISSWNIRGLNRSLKQSEVRYMIEEHHLNLCAILESHVDVSSVYNVCKSICKKWSWTSNGKMCTKGTRIIVGWNTDVVDLMVLSQSNQAMHVQVTYKLDKKSLFCSFIYADNNYIQRRVLWKDLGIHSLFVRGRPWVMLGDFNSALNLEDQYAGSSLLNSGMRDFKECVNSIEMVDVNCSGFHYTWNQKPKSGGGILKKLDRVMGNVQFLIDFPSAHALFQPYRISDHSPCILKIPNIMKAGPKPFKFANFLIFKAGFMDEVDKVWGGSFSGNNMYKLVCRLKALKSPMRKLLFAQGNLHVKVTNLRVLVDNIQKEIDDDPGNIALRDKEVELVKEFNEAKLDEERLLKQKSKVEWLQVGDSNSKFFHNSVKCKNHIARIDRIMDKNGVVFVDTDVPNALVDHFTQFLGVEGHTSERVDVSLFPRRLSEFKALNMVRAVTSNEIKQAIFSIGNDKAPGPDGFSAAFFKATWDVVGQDVSNAIMDFFLNGKLLKEVNHTILALIPKVSTPNSVLDYRPISCCNVVYKCISKIITNRIKDGLDDIVDINQSAFIPGRRISDNILLVQELMHNYHRNVGPPKCAFKVDIQKAYDTVDWDFLRSLLKAFGFHARMVSWIMTCVTTSSFSIGVNGNIYGFFRGKRGLRQGDPMSPYLFTMVMEYLTLILKDLVHNSSVFRFHNTCKKQRIINICFADDLFLFSRGDLCSAKVLMTGLERFKNASGLVPSVAKSTVFFGNVSTDVKLSILRLISFEEGCLPVRYLGVPLISTRLLYRDCKILVEKLEARIQNWKNKSLSFAGRLQLIRSVLSSMHIYWASVFILPDRIISDLEKRMRVFLWSHGIMKKGKAKVKWKEVCLPKYEGGLGIRRLTDMNKALISSHIWSVITKRNSLWVSWIYDHKLKDRSFWDVRLKDNSTWSWRKLCSLRDTVRSFVISKIGNGVQTSAWFDSWSSIGPLADVISSRFIHGAGFNHNSTVRDIVENGNWLWPVAWYDLFPVLIHLQPPLLNDYPDVRLWRDNNGKEWEFSTSVVWESIRPHTDRVPWVDLVWFSNCIPRHSFLLWLVCKKKLKTQDKMQQWDVGGVQNLNLMCCSLCKRGQDSHDHLFFECSFSKQLWELIIPYIGVHISSNKWDDIIDLLVVSLKHNSVQHLICKLLFAATVYYIWQERNARLFSKDVRSVLQIKDTIVSIVRLKISSVKFKKAMTGMDVLKDWEIPKL